MATTSTLWTENQTFTGGITAQTNIAQTTSSEVDLAASGYDMIVAQIEITSMGTSTSVTVEVFSSPDSGTTFDDVAILSYNVTAVEIRTIPIMAHPYVKITITDDDATSSVDTDGHWAGRQWETV